MVNKDPEHEKTSVEKRLLVEQETNPHATMYTVGGYVNYTIAKSHEILMKLIRKNIHRLTKYPKTYCEVIPTNTPLCLFIDIDLNETLTTTSPSELHEQERRVHEQGDAIVMKLKQDLDIYFKDYERKYIVLSSHGIATKKEKEKDVVKRKYSLHIILRLSKNGKDYYISKQQDIPVILRNLGYSPTSVGPDFNVYGVNKSKLFRTIYSPKPGEKRLLTSTTLPFGDQFEDIESLVMYKPNLDYEIIESTKNTGIHKTTKSQTKNTKKLETTEKISSTEDLDIYEDIKTILKRVLTNQAHRTARNAGMSKRTLLKNCIERISSMERTTHKDSITYKITYKGHCILKGEKHNSNSCIATITPQKITFSCYSRKKENPNCSTKKTYDITLTTYEIETLFFEEDQYIQESQEFEAKQKDLKSQISQQFLTIDPGIHEESILGGLQGSYYADTTPQLTTPYNEGGFNRHSFSQNGHELLGPNNEPLTILAADHPKITNLINMIENMKIENPNIGNDNRQYTNNITNITKQYNTQDIIADLTSSDLNIVSELIELDEIRQSVLDFLNCPNHFSLGSIYFSLSKNRIFVHDKDIYVWEDPIWATKDKNFLASDIASTLMPFFISLKNKLMQHREEKRICDEEYQKIGSIIQKNSVFAGQSPQVQGVITLALARLTSSGKYKLLDQNTTIVPFNNGVFDIELGKFRPAVMEDYITKTTGYDYDPNVCTDQVMEFLKSIMPDTEHLRYLLEITTYLVDGTYTNDLFHFLIGNGSNGKSLFINTLKKCFGDLAVTTSATMFTSKDTDPNAPRSDVMKLKNVRIGLGSETSDNSKVNIAFLKRLTGGELGSYRDLYGKQEEIEITSKFVFACNALPELELDEAIKRRLRYVKFGVHFVDNPTKPGEALRIPSLAKNIKKSITWGMAFFKIIEPYFGREPKPTPFMQDFTKHIIDEVDPVGSFVLENMEYKTDGCVGVVELLHHLCTIQGLSRPKTSSATYKQMLKSAKKNMAVLMPPQTLLNHKRPRTNSCLYKGREKSGRMKIHTNTISPIAFKKSYFDSVKDQFPQYHWFDSKGKPVEGWEASINKPPLREWYDFSWDDEGQGEE